MHLALVLQPSPDSVRRMLLARKPPFSMKTVKVAVAVIDRSGNALVPYFTVTCAEHEYDAGHHYEMARQRVRDAGMEPQAAFDENDPSWPELSSISFDGVDLDSVRTNFERQRAR